MSDIRVMAFLVTPEDRDAAASELKDLSLTNAFAIGSTTIEGAEKLRHSGLIVQELTQRAQDARFRAPETPGMRGLRRPTASPGLTRSSIRQTRDSSHTTITPDEDMVMLIEIAGPLLTSYKAEIEELGGRLMEGYANGYYSVWIRADKAEQLGNLPFISRLRPYDAADNGSASPEKTVRGAASKPVEVDWDIRLHRPDDMPALKSWLTDHGIAVKGASARKVRIALTTNNTLRNDIAALPIVQRIERYVNPVLWNDRAAVILGVRQNIATLPQFDGSGQIVAIADTGIDDKHGDLAPNLLAAVALGRAGDFSDTHGHGTHVAGSVAGTGATSGGQLKGMAPAARIYFQSLLDEKGGLGGLPVDLADLFQPAYDAGARIHSNSWGAATASTYTVNADEVDDFVYRQRDMLVVVAAGNEGKSVGNLNALKGVVDWLSIGSPATAKNGLTVGASRSDRTDGPTASVEWRDWWPKDFPDLPISNELISGDPNGMAAFSSRGPSDDRRIKPDLVAPGTDILSTRSVDAPDEEFWGLYSANPHYAYMGGTSMATPLVSGCAALVRQYYLGSGHSPSAALVRATLINGTRWLSGPDANASNRDGATFPAGNFDQGFGRLDLTTTLPAPQGHLRLLFVDDWAQADASFASSGEARRFSLKVEQATSLRICLAYTDFPGRSLQNNLNLFVQPPGGGPKLMGNAQLRNSLGLPDVDNNVEIVRVQNPVSGRYLIQVSATNILHGPQDFALVLVADGQISFTEV